MLSVNDLKNGSVIVIDGDPFTIMSIKHQHIGRGASSSQTRIRNLRTGQVLERNYKASDAFEEADVEKVPTTFLYSHRNEFWFCERGNPKSRFSLSQDTLGESAQFLKSNMEIISLQFEGNTINIELPIKGDYKVIESPPAVRGNTAQGGNKTVTIEGGAKVITPMFISEGDIIRVNTTTGEYAERIKKA